MFVFVVFISKLGGIHFQTDHTYAIYRYIYICVNCLTPISLEIKGIKNSLALHPNFKFKFKKKKKEETNRVSNVKFFWGCCCCIFGFFFDYYYYYLFHFFFFHNKNFPCLPPCHHRYPFPTLFFFSLSLSLTLSLYSLDSLHVILINVGWLITRFFGPSSRKKKKKKRNIYIQSFRSLFNLYLDYLLSFSSYIYIYIHH